MHTYTYLYDKTHIEKTQRANVELNLLLYGKL